MFKRISILTVAALLTSGCASDFNGYYLRNSFGFDTVCLLDNRNVPAPFFIALRKALENKGLNVKTVKNYTSDELMCPATVMYEASYENAPVPYLEDAKLLFVKENEPTVVVNLKKGKDRVVLLDKMADSETAIREMVNRLLPRSTPW